MNDLITNGASVTNLQNCVQQIFECDENIEDLQSKITLTKAETILIQHLNRAIDILDLHVSKHFKFKN